MQKFILCLVLLISLFANNWANAQSNQVNPLNDYVAYNKALDEGNFTTAEDYAFKAWNNAEKLWGDKNKNTAAFAFNAALISALNYDYKNASLPAQRAKDLIRIGQDFYNFDQIDFLVKYIEYKNNTKSASKGEIEDLEKAALLVINNWNNEVIIDAFADISKDYLSLNYLKKSFNTIEKANELNTQLQIGSQVMDFKIAVNFMRYYLKTYDYGKAVEYSNQARLKYGPPSSLEDKVWANLYAWNKAIINAAVENGYKDISKCDKNCERTYSLLSDEQYKQIDYEVSKNCEKPDGFERDTNIGEKIKGPNYNDFYTYSKEGYIGSVITLLNIDEQGYVKNIRILSEIPSNDFSEAVIKSVSKWRYKNVDKMKKECREQWVHSFNFYIKYD